MNILVIYSSFNYKTFLYKVSPLSDLEEIENIYLVSTKPVSYPKVINYCPKGIFALNVFIRETCRFLFVIWIMLTRKVDFVIGIHFIMHGVYAGIAGLLFRKRFILVLIENPFVNLNPTHKFSITGSFDFFLKRAHAIGVRGKNCADLIINSGIEAKKVFIPNNYYIFQPVDKKEISNNKIYDIIFIGLFVVEKRLDVLVKSLHLLKGMLPDFKAIFLGDGTLFNEIKELINYYELQGNIDLKGFTPNVDEFLVKSKVLMLTSQTEGLPMVLVQALNYGVPCIVSDVGDVKEVAIHNYNSLIIEPMNIEKFALAAHSLLTNEKLLLEFSKNALKIAEEKKHEYSLEDIKQVWAKILVSKN